MMQQLRVAAPLVALFLLPLGHAFGSGSEADVARWDFDVYLNDKRVGRHVFEVAEANGVREVQSEADFEYRILFVPAYRYRHSNSERWAGDCLLEFEARTSANGRRLIASGARTGEAFRVTGNAGVADLPGCVMTFAYWNPVFLQQPRLLNPQSGEFLDVSVERLETETLTVRGQSVPATPYRVRAGQLELKVWYSPDEEWLALESVAKGGNVIRYELS